MVETHDVLILKVAILHIFLEFTLFKSRRDLHWSFSYFLYFPFIPDFVNDELCSYGVYSACSEATHWRYGRIYVGTLVYHCSPGETMAGLG